MPLTYAGPRIYCYLSLQKVDHMNLIPSSSRAGSSRKLELLSRPILKEHAMYMDSFLRQLLHIINNNNNIAFCPKQVGVGYCISSIDLLWLLSSWCFRLCYFQFGDNFETCLTFT